MYVRGPPPAALWVAGLGAAGAIGELHSGELGDRREPELVGVEVARPVDVVRGDGGLDRVVDQHGGSRPWSATLTEVADTGAAVGRRR
jgi:poly(3-hydroxybutyrate) depolymerase